MLCKLSLPSTLLLISVFYIMMCLKLITKSPTTQLSSLNSSTPGNNNTSPIIQLRSLNSSTHENNDINSAFQWSSLNSSTPGICGAQKCFFDVLDDSTHGYLITYRSPYASNLTLGWERAMMLTKKYSSKHFYLSRPEVVSVSEELYYWCSDIPTLARESELMFYELGTHEFLRVAATPKDENDLSKNFFNIQKVKKAPTPHLEWGDKDKRRRRCDKEFKLFNSSLPNRAEFSRRLDTEIVALVRLLKKEQWLLADFQIIIDQQGVIYHIDLDRNKNLEVYYEDFLERQRFVKEKLGNISQEVRDNEKSSYSPC